jgi:hypothetical protein
MALTKATLIITSYKIDLDIENRIEGKFILSRIKDDLATDELVCLKRKQLLMEVLNVPLLLPLINIVVGYCPIAIVQGLLSTPIYSTDYNTPITLMSMLMHFKGSIAERTIQNQLCTRDQQYERQQLIITRNETTLLSTPLYPKIPENTSVTHVITTDVQEPLQNPDYYDRLVISSRLFNPPWRAKVLYEYPLCARYWNSWQQMDSELFIIQSAKIGDYMIVLTQLPNKIDLAIWRPS